MTSVAKEGYLRKKAEHLKNWKSRYFILRTDGTFCGYKEQPQNFTEPINNFTVVGSQILTQDKPPDSYIFTIRGLHSTSVIERTFACRTALERESWIKAIHETSKNVRQSAALQQSNSTTSSSSSSTKKKVSFEDFHYLKVLGKGTFGKVILCQEKNSGRFYAMKILKKSVIVQKDEVDHVLTENRVLMKNNHPFVTQMKHSFQTEHHLCFVMEYANGGELFFHLSKERVFSENRARFYAAEITSALGYLHKNDVVYRDLKLENLLLDIEGHIKIADFGLCKEQMTDGRVTTTFCGTPEYLAPEVLADRDYDKSVDWWGLGVVCYEMMVGRLPFYSQNHEKLFQAIVNDPVKFPRNLSEAARSLLTGLLEKEPARRLGSNANDAAQVMAHPFFQTINFDALQKKAIDPPWKPEVTSETDTRYFEDQFTREPVRLTPPEKDTSNKYSEPFQTFFNFSASRYNLAANSSENMIDEDVDMNSASDASMQMDRLSIGGGGAGGSSRSNAQNSTVSPPTSGRTAQSAAGDSTPTHCGNETESVSSTKTTDTHVSGHNSAIISDGDHMSVDSSGPS